MAPNGKIAALRAASHQLLRQLKSAAANPGAVQIAIIPFMTDVNVGKSNVSAAWLKWSYTALSPLGYGNTNISTVTVGQSTWTGSVTDRDQSYHDACARTRCHIAADDVVESVALSRAARERHHPR
jgi:hypothetical protein